MSTGDSTRVLLGRWAAGDADALAALVREHLPWVRALVVRRLGPLLRQREDPEDLVQDALLEVMRDGPRFVLETRAQFRALLARLVENLLRDRLEWHLAGKRDFRREQGYSRASTLILDPSLSPPTRPSQAAMQNEREAWVQLALELVSPADRRIVLLREWEGLSFGAIGTELGIEENTARMRFQAALQRLADKLRELRDGRVARALASEGTLA